MSHTTTDILITAPLPDFLAVPLARDFRCHDYHRSSSKPELLAASFEDLTFTPDPLASTVQASADAAVAAGLADAYDLGDLFAISLLDEILAAQGAPPVGGP